MDVEAGVAHVSRPENPRASLLRPDGRGNVALDDTHALLAQHVPESIGSRVGAGADDHNLANVVRDRTFEDVVVTEGAKQQVIVKPFSPEAADPVPGDIAVRCSPRGCIEQVANLGVRIAPRTALVRVLNIP